MIETPSPATFAESLSGFAAFLDAQTELSSADIKMCADKFRDAAARLRTLTTPASYEPSEEAAKAAWRVMIEYGMTTDEIKAMLRAAFSIDAPRIVAQEREKLTALGGMASVLADLRTDGWTVAVHNDYRLNGEAHTFWLFTKGERAIKGEGRTDFDALRQVALAAAIRARGPSPAPVAGEYHVSHNKETGLVTFTLEDVPVVAEPAFFGKHHFADVLKSMRSRNHVVGFQVWLPSPAPVEAGTVEDRRPASCRNRMRDAGKPYPRSGCNHCGDGGLMGCPFDRTASAHVEVAYRHKKRGTTYDVVGLASLQTETPLSDFAPVVVYRCRETGILWARNWKPRSAAWRTPLPQP